MTARAIVIVGMAALLSMGLAGTGAPEVSAAVTDLRVEWETVARGGKAIVRGYVYNEQQMRVENVRLRIEQLDASARPVVTRTAWVLGTIPYRDRLYFETAVPVSGGTYRVIVESFDWAQCGNG